jgi:hypothetical protein
MSRGICLDKGETAGYFGKHVFAEWPAGRCPAGGAAKESDLTGTKTEI